jgi:hypothetical protein
MENHSEYGSLPIILLPSGTVDFDHYEARARVLRREAWRAFGRSMADSLRRLWALAQSLRQRRASPTRSVLTAR